MDPHRWLEALDNEEYGWMQEQIQSGWVDPGIEVYAEKTWQPTIYRLAISCSNTLQTTAMAHFCLEHGFAVSAPADEKSEHLPAHICIIRACRDRSLEMIQALVNHAPPLNLRATVEALSCSIANQVHPKVALYLLSLIPPETDLNKKKLLLNAVDFDQVKLIKALLSRGVRADDATHYGVTPLMRALQRGSVEVAQMLLGAGANLDVKTSKGEDLEECAWTPASRVWLENQRHRQQAHANAQALEEWVPTPESSPRMRRM